MIWNRFVKLKQNYYLLIEKINVNWLANQKLGNVCNVIQGGMQCIVVGGGGPIMARLYFVNVFNIYVKPLWQSGSRCFDNPIVMRVFSVKCGGRL